MQFIECYKNYTVATVAWIIIRLSIGWCNGSVSKVKLFIEFYRNDFWIFIHNGQNQIEQPNNQNSGRKYTVCLCVFILGRVCRCVYRCTCIMYQTPFWPACTRMRCWHHDYMECIIAIVFMLHVISFASMDFHTHTLVICVWNWHLSKCIFK